MGKKVPEEVRMEAVRRVVELGESVANVAHDMDFARSTVNNWKRKSMKALKDESENARLKERLKELEGLLKDKDEKIFKLLNDVDYERRSKSEILQEIIKKR